MRVGLDGQPARTGILNAQIGVVHTDAAGENTLVILDADTNEQIHVPLKDAQVEKFYKDWTGKHIQPASAQDFKQIVNDHPIGQG